MRVLALSLLLSTSASAAPTLLTHQGRLLDSAGTPLTGSQDITVTLYDDPATGNALWTETLTTTVEDGYYTLLLGESTPVDPALLDDEMYVEVSVGSNALPRRRVASVPFALSAAEAQRAVTATNVDGGTVNATSIQLNGTPLTDSTGRITATIDGVLLSDLTCSAAGQLASWTGSAWSCEDPPELSLPGDLADGDDDTLGALDSCQGGQIAKWSGSAWACADDDDTTADVLGSLTSATAVGIGTSAGSATLTLSGGLRLGTHGTCDDSNRGVLQYTDDAGLQACTATGWVSIAGGTLGSENNPVTSCRTLLEAGNNQSGPYWIDPDGGGSAPKQLVWCDQDTDGGGWTVLQWDVASKQQTGGYGIPADAYGWSLDYQSTGSFWANVGVDDFYIEVDGVYQNIWSGVTIKDDSRMTPKWIFSGGQAVSWGCDSDAAGSTCHFKDGSGRFWGQWLNTSGCCLGGGGIWYYSHNDTKTLNYGLCQDGYPNGSLGTGTAAPTGCQAGNYTSFSPTGSQAFKYAIRY